MTSTSNAAMTIAIRVLEPVTADTAASIAGTEEIICEVKAVKRTMSMRLQTFNDRNSSTSGVAQPERSTFHEDNTIREGHESGIVCD